MAEAHALAGTRAEPSALVVGACLTAALAAVAVLYRDSFATMIGVWSQSDTFMHCYLIAPISAFLVWQQRHELAEAPKRVSALGFAAIAVLSAGWYAADAVDVQVGQHLTATMLIPAVVLAVLGRQAAGRIAMPLLYLLFAVPFGEALIPALMDFTASFTVSALRLTGIPVLREGLYFSIPSGDFEVAKACSGIRYLIACLAVGVLYAHFAYRSWRKRLLFVAVSIVAPIIANGIRAYLIVMIAHLSDMRLAVGIDHLIYGWLFFAGLLALLFWLGSRFADPEVPFAAGSSAGPTTSRGAGATAAAAALAVAVAALGPVLALRASPAAGEQGPGAHGLPVLAGTWTGPRNAAAPLPAAARGAYVSGNAEVEMQILVYAAQDQGRESVRGVDDVVAAYGAQVLEKRMAPGPGFAVNETVLRIGRTYRVLRHWYVVGNTPVAADWRTKLLEAWRLLVHRQASTALVIVAADAAEPRAAADTLTSFLADGREELAACLTENRGCTAPRH